MSRREQEQYPRIADIGIKRIHEPTNRFDHSSRNSQFGTDLGLNSEMEQASFSDSHPVLESFSEANSTPIINRHQRRVQSPESNQKRRETTTLQHQMQREEYLRILGDSEEKQRKRLQSLYLQEGSRVKLVEKLHELGIKVSKETLRIWIDKLGVSNPEKKKPGARINKENRDLIQEASREGHLWLLDEWYRGVLQGRYLFEEGSKPMTLSDLRESAGVSTKQGVQIIEQDAIRIIKRLKNGESIRDIDKKLAKRILNNLESLKALHEDIGLSTKQIASKLGYSRDTVVKAMKRLGIPLKRGPKGGSGMRSEDEEELVRLYTIQELPIWKIAKRLGISEPTISGKLRARGVVISRGRPRKNNQ